LPFSGPKKINPHAKSRDTMPIKLSDDRKNEITQILIDFYKSEFEEELSPFRAQTLVEFMMNKIGPSHYNQAITDARKYMAEKLDDLDAEFYEPEDP